MLASLAAMTIGMIPSLISAYENPAHEDLLAWVIIATASTSAILGTAEWNLVSLMQPASFLVCQVGMIGILYLRR